MKKFILDAIYRGDIPTFRKFYKEELKKRYRDDTEICTAAISSGNRHILSDLLAEAISAGDVKRIEDLIEAGADPNVKDAAGRTSLHTGVFKIKQSLDITLALLRGGADPNIKDSGGDTPAMIAATIGSLETMKVMADAGADFNIRDSEGLSAIDTLIILHPHVYDGFIKYLREQGFLSFDIRYPINRKYPFGKKSPNIER